jgi:hypothetical protein
MKKERMNSKNQRESIDFYDDYACCQNLLILQDLNTFQKNIWGLGTGSSLPRI